MFKNWLKFLRQDSGLMFHLLPQQDGSNPLTATPKAILAQGRSQTACPTWKIPAYLRQRMSGDRISRDY